MLGAGPAGLSAAWYAVRRGFSVVVVDRAERVGGLAASIVVDGQSVDLGSHRLHPSIRADLLGDLRDVLHLDVQWRPRNGRIRLGGRWVAFPLRPLDLLRNARPSFSVRVLGDVAAASVRRRLGSSSGAASFIGLVRRNLGGTIARAFYEPFARKLWGVDGDRLSAELFRRRVSAGSASAILRKLVGRHRRSGFWYPPGGFGAICSMLADDFVRRGGVLLTASEIESIDVDRELPQVCLRDGRSIVSHTVVSTIPSANLVDMVGAPADVVEAARALEFRGALLVYLTVARSQYTSFDAHYFPESSTIVSRLSEPKNYRSSPTDPPLRTVLCAEVPATVGDELWRSDDDELARRVCRELEQQGLPDPAPVASHVERRTHVYPVYRLGFEHQQHTIDEHLDQRQNLVVVGRQALFAHDNTHHALLMGKEVVDALGDDARIDRERWNAARRLFANHVVED